MKTSLITGKHVGARFGAYDRTTEPLCSATNRGTEPQNGGDHVSSSPAKLLLREREAASLLCVSERTLFAHRKAGEIGFVRIGRSVRYLMKDLEDFIESKAKRKVANPDSSDKRMPAD